MSSENSGASDQSAAGAGSPNSGGNKVGLIISVVNLVGTLGMLGLLFMSFRKESQKPSVEDIAAHGTEAAEAKSEGGGHEKAKAEEGHGGGGGEEHGGGARATRLLRADMAKGAKATVAKEQLQKRNLMNMVV